jgi:hypothetical protein
VPSVFTKLNLKAQREILVINAPASLIVVAARAYALRSTTSALDFQG